MNPALILLSAAALFVAFVLYAVWWSEHPDHRKRRFMCPHCGGRHWSSGQPFRVGRCVGCGFTWKRVDDARYFEVDR